MFQRRLIGEIALGGGVLVTSYSHVVGKLDTLLQHDWHYVVLDEGHKIRNPDAQATLAVKQVGYFVVRCDFLRRSCRSSLLSIFMLTV